MAKKKTTKKKEEELPSFEEICKKFRAEKVIEKKNKKDMDKSKKYLQIYAERDNLHGDYHGIKISPNYTFLAEKNIELAKEQGIKLPSDIVVKIDYDKLVEVAKEAGLEIPEIREEVVDLKKLEQIFIKQEISGHYQFKHYAFGLSTKE